MAKFGFKKIFKILFALTLVAPVMSSAGVALAADSSYYIRNPQTGEIPILPKLDNGIPFNRPVYMNDPAANDGYNGTTSSFANTMVNRDSAADLPDAKTFLDNQKDAGAYLFPYSDSNKTYKHPQIQLIYTLTPETIAKKIKGNSYNNYFSKINETFDFSKVTNIPNYLADTENAMVDYNTDGQLELQYRYSVTIDDLSINIFNQDKLINTIKKNGLNFNAYVRVPDGYKSNEVIDAVIGKVQSPNRYSQLLINPKESSIQNSLPWQNTDPGFEVVPADASGSYKPLQAVDDHLLKFSVNSATNDAYKDTITKWIKKNVGAGLTFIKMIRRDLPIQLQMLLNMNKMSAAGDQFDLTPKQALTKGRKLPAVDNKTAINAYFLSSNKLFKVSPASGKYAYFPVNNQNDIDIYNKSMSDQQMKKPGPMVMDNYISGAGFSDNAHPILKNDTILSNETTITNGSNYSVENEFDPAYMNTNGGNAFETWNQYISLYDTQNKYNTEDDKNEIVNMGTASSPKITMENLPGSYGLDRSVAIRTADVDHASNTFDPMRFYRSVNYFNKLDTTEQTKKNVEFAEIKADGSPVRYKNPVNPDKRPVVELKPGTSKEIWYYGTDEKGHPFSPAKLTVNRPKFEYNSTTQAKLKDVDMNFTNKLEAADGAWVTEKNKFEIFDPIGGETPKIKDNVIKVKLPAGATVGKEGLQYRIKLGSDVVPINQTSLTDNHDGTYFIKLNSAIVGKDTPITVEYDYQVHGNVGDQIKTKQNTISGIDTDPTDIVPTSGVVDPVSTITIGKPELTLKSVPASVDFGRRANPSSNIKLLNPKISYPSDAQNGVGIDYNSAMSGKNPTGWNITLKLEDSNLPGILNFKPKENSQDWIPLSASPQSILSNKNEQLTDGLNYLIPKLNFSFDTGPGYNVEGKKYGGTLKWQLVKGPRE